MFIGGRSADRYIARRLTARLTVAAVGFLVGAAALAPGLFASSVWLALPFFLVAGAAISEPNPPLDAARLDIMASGLWGRAESVRTAVRGVFQSFAPVAFGFMSSLFAGGSSPGWGAGINAAHGAVSSAQAGALRDTFLIMLVTLVAVFLAYNANQGLPFVPTQELKVDVANAEQLVNGNEVRAGGYQIGLLSDMRPVRFPNGQVGAQLTLELSKK